MLLKILASGRGTPLLLLLAGFTLLHVATLGLFARGFLLTRVELTTRSSCDEPGVNDKSLKASDGSCGTSSAVAPSVSASNDTQRRQPGGDCDRRPSGCWGDKHFSKAAWVIVDALRFDFVACEGTAAAGHGCRSRMPKLLDLAQLSGPAAQMYRFVADPPTTTMQRLRGILTGGLPTFVDVGASFSAAAVAEDNLIDQLVAAGRRLAFVGDDTWMQLFPHQFGDAAPFPSFNVRDLHTVDNGVWEYLVPAVRNATGWDVLVGHYLGVDHAGHTDDVFAPTMAAKLAQMDTQLAQVVDEMAALAGPGAQHADTLLLIWGDHGQTDSGDHGGGSAPEVDSVLVAVDLAALHARRRSRSSDGEQRVAEAAGAGGPGSSDEWQPAHAASAGRHMPQAASAWPTMPQVDFAPTMAALLGVPMPYASIGRVSHGLWHLRGCRGGGDSQSCRRRYAATLQANAWQVQRYLRDYAASDGGHLPTADLARSQDLYATATATGEAEAGSDAHISRLAEYLQAAADLARQQWTQFGLPSMGTGVTLLAATLAVQLAACWALMHHAPGPSDSAAAAAAPTSMAAGSTVTAATRHPGGDRQPWGAGGAARGAAWQWAVEGAAWAAVLGHAAALFSNSFILAQGRMLAFLLAALVALLGRSTVSLLLQCQQGDRHSEAIRVSGATDRRQDHGSSNMVTGGSWGNAGASEGRATAQPTAAPARRCSPACEAALLTCLLLAANWGLAAHGLVQRSGHDAMWRTAAEHHTLLVPDASAAPAAAAATHQTVASPANAATAAHTMSASPSGDVGASGLQWRQLSGIARLRAWQPAVVAAAATAWRLGSTYGALLLLPALMSWLDIQITRNLAAPGAALQHAGPGGGGP